MKAIPSFLCQQEWSMEKLRVDSSVQKNCLGFAVYRSIEGGGKTLLDNIFTIAILKFIDDRQNLPCLFGMFIRSSSSYQNSQEGSELLHTCSHQEGNLELPPQICEQDISCQRSLPKLGPAQQAPHPQQVRAVKSGVGEVGGEGYKGTQRGRAHKLISSSEVLSHNGRIR